jgi:DNA-binding cell septation regulator SpoVG
MNNQTLISLSEIEIIPIKPVNGLLGWGSFVLNEQFYIGNVGIHSTPYGTIRLLYPEKILPNGKTVSSFHPITKNAGSEITDQIIRKYNDLFASKTNELGALYGAR